MIGSGLARKLMLKTIDTRLKKEFESYRQLPKPKQDQVAGLVADHIQTNGIPSNPDETAIRAELEEIISSVAN